MENDRRLTGTLVRKVFEILLEYPEGLHFRRIMWQLNESYQHTDSSNQIPDSPPSVEEIATGCVAAIKAGWLVNKNDVFALSAEGQDAYARYVDAEKFLTEAARRSTKGWLSVNFPRSYSYAGRLKDNCIAEYRTLRRIGLRRLAKQFVGTARPWQDVLPMQEPRQVVGPQIDALSGNALRSEGLPYGEGRHTIYLPPKTIEITGFQVIADMYPPNVGLKIVKNQGGIEETGYITGRTKGDSTIQLNSIHSHRHLTLVANLLYVKGVGPRLYDLLELHFGDQVWTAYVLEHVDGVTPSIPECEAGIEKLRCLERDGLLKVILPDGFNDEEFECPTCSGNTLVDHDGNFRYVDFQNFLLTDYERFLTSLALEASNKTHFGDELGFRGGRYLYQSIPGVNLPAKRNIEERIPAFQSLMDAAGVTLKGKLVLDVGCNIGMMMAQYLKLGARWCHGWDRAQTTPYTEQLLLALGCTRFSTTPTDITSDQPLETDLPPFLVPSLDGCVISYLAIRGHIGWLDALARIPWSFLLYEGHEGESQEDFDTHMTELRRLTPFKVTGVSTYSDGDSEPRAVALLVRN